MSRDECDYTLALLGGSPLIDVGLAPYCSLGAEEEKAVTEVLRSGCLSGFYGSWRDEFYGGPKVQEFERRWSEKFGSRHTISVNSNTSGLVASVGAAGIGPGDEVIVPCTTMSATAMAPLVYGAIPVFADVEDETFCIDLDSVRENLSDRTRAIIAVNLFGHGARLAELRNLADKLGVVLIEDNAQGPLATENGRLCGTIGHIGVFSLNYHKHIHTGEGGMCATDDDRLAERLRMIRNHAEAVAGPAKVEDLTNLVGFNFRMTELSAAVGLVQLRHIDDHVARRKQAAELLTRCLDGLDGISVPQVRSGCEHVYYIWALRYDADVAGPSRTAFVRALNAEGFLCDEGYVEPLYMLPLFRKRRAIGRDGFPFTLTERRYEKGMCPTAERLHEKELIVFQPCAWELDGTVVEKLASAVRKVHANRAALVAWERQQTA